MDSNVQLLNSTLTLFDAEAGGPLLQGDVLVLVSVALLKETGGAMLHGNEGGAQRGELRVGQVSGDPQTAGRSVTAAHANLCHFLLPVCRPGVGGASFRRSSRYVPVNWVLVELTELPVDGEDVHVVVLLEVAGQQVQRVLAGLQSLLVLIDLLYLE